MAEISIKQIESSKKSPNESKNTVIKKKTP